MRKIKAIFTNHYVQKFQWPKQEKTYNFDKFTKQIPADRFYKQFLLATNTNGAPWNLKFLGVTRAVTHKMCLSSATYGLQTKFGERSRCGLQKNLVNPEITASFQNIKKTWNTLNFWQMHGLISALYFQISTYHTQNFKLASHKKTIIAEIYFFDRKRTMTFGRVTTVTFFC